MRLRRKEKNTDLGIERCCSGSRSQTHTHTESAIPIYGGFVRVHGCLWLCGCRAGHLRQRPLNKLLLRITVYLYYTLHLQKKRKQSEKKKAIEWQTQRERQKLTEEVKRKAEDERHKDIMWRPRTAGGQSLTQSLASVWTFGTSWRHGLKTTLKNYAFVIWDWI